MPCFIDRTGEERVSKKNQRMKIIAYRSAKDIDVEFEDGTVVYHRTYSNFKKGEIGNPNYSLQKSSNDRVGKSVIAKNKQRMTIIAYRSTRDIDVMFEDERIERHKTLQSFNKGEIRNKSLPHSSKFKDRTGATAISSCNIKMEIIKYRGANDIDVMFYDDDKTIVEHKTVSNFNKGLIRYPKRKC